jgi:nicotinamidase/pyrazinamidase
MLLTPNDCVMVVDYQNDFITGSLSVPKAGELVLRINTLVTDAAQGRGGVIYTRDWHPANHCSFKEYGGIWPKHCLAFSHGADYPAALLMAPSHHRVWHIHKGTSRDADEYGAFEREETLRVLMGWDIRRVLICGVATDYCVKETALGAMRCGFKTLLCCGAVAGVDSDTVGSALDEMVGAGVEFVG